MIVEAGATIQPKRSDCESCAIGPAPGSPCAMPAIASRRPQTARGVELGRDRGEARLVDVRAQLEEVELAAEQHEPDVDALAALDPRHDAQERVGERAGVGVRLEHVPPPRRTRAAPRAGRAGSRRCPRRRASGRSPSQTAGHERDRLVDGRPRARAARRSSASRDRARRRQQHVVGEHRHRLVRGLARAAARRAAGRSAAPWSISHVRPCQISRFGLRCVRSTFVTSVSNQTTSAANVGIDRALERQRERQRRRAGSPCRGSARRSRRAAPGCRGPARRGPSRRGISTTARSGTSRPSRRASSPATTSATSAFSPCPEPAELRDVHAVVGGLDEARQRAALAQRRHVAGRAYAGQRGGHVRQSRSRARTASRRARRRRSAGPGRHEVDLGEPRGGEAGRAREQDRRVELAAQVRVGAGTTARASRASSSQLSASPSGTRAAAAQASSTSPPERRACAMAPNASSSVSANQSAAARSAPAVAPSAPSSPSGGERARLLDERRRERA